MWSWNGGFIMALCYGLEVENIKVYLYFIRYSLQWKAKAI